jgi:hypothetical protein
MVLFSFFGFAEVVVSCLGVIVVWLVAGTLLQ